MSDDPKNRILAPRTTGEVDRVAGLGKVPLWPECSVVGDVGRVRVTGDELSSARAYKLQWVDAIGPIVLLLLLLLVAVVVVLLEQIAELISRLVVASLEAAGSPFERPSGITSRSDTFYRI